MAPSEFIPISAFFLEVTHSTLYFWAFPLAQALFPVAEVGLATLGWPFLALKELGSFGDIFFWEGLTEALTRTTEVRLAWQCTPLALT